MWKYNSTNEVIFKGTKKDNNVLYHSDVYLGQEFSDGIKHWKYIKKEKKNGRWVYYYNDSDLKKYKQEADRNEEALRYENKKRGYGDDASRYYAGKDPVYKKLAKDANTSDWSYMWKQYESSKRKEKYKTPIKALNTISNTIYKGKKWFSKLFK